MVAGDGENDGGGRVGARASPAGVGAPAVARARTRTASAKQQRRRRKSGDRDELRLLQKALRDGPPAAASTAPAPAAAAPSRSARPSCAQRTLSFLLLLSLIAATGICAVLVAALFGAFPAGPPKYFAVPLTLEPPCDEWPPALPPDLPALPPPPRCSWSWSRFRCRPTYRCELKMRWLPLPRPKCQMRQRDWGDLD